MFACDIGKEKIIVYQLRISNNCFHGENMLLDKFGTTWFHNGFNTLLISIVLKYFTLDNVHGIRVFLQMSYNMKKYHSFTQQKDSLHIKI